MSRCPPLLVLFTALSVHAGVPADKLAMEGVTEFTAASQAWDAARLDAAVDIFRRATTAPSATATNYYWLGAAEFHRVLHLHNRVGGAAAARAMDAAVESLKTAVRLDEHHAESHALLGTLYGMRIDGSLLRAARLGPRVQRHRDLALASGANNPRVQYLLGVCQFHTAKKAADRREALSALLRAEKLFEAEAGIPPAPLEPRWGRAGCMMFIARACESLGRRDEAAGYYRKALALQPGAKPALEGLERVGGGS